MSFRRVLRTFASALVLVGGLAFSAPRARAGPDSLLEASHRQAEDAFVVGRLDDLDAILGTGKAAVDLEPLAVRDLLWRPSNPRQPFTVSADDRGLSARRIAWLVRLAAHRAGGLEVRSPYPGPEAGEKDTYPRLFALVRDRLRRETVGARGLPKESPLAEVADEDIQAFQSWYARRAYQGPLPEDLSEEDRRAEAALRRRVTEIGSRNEVLGGVGLLALILFAWSLGRLVRDPRKIRGSLAEGFDQERAEHS